MKYQHSETLCRQPEEKYMQRRELRLRFLLLLLLSVLIISCDQAPTPAATAGGATAVPPANTPEPTSPPAPTAVSAPPQAAAGVLISELLPGIPGNNNYEFIELYNAGADPVNIQGWSLWYRNSDNQDEQLVYRWSENLEIPGYGHLLLLREGQEFDLTADAHFDTPLFERRGGIQLRDKTTAVVDQLGWGAEAPPSFTSGSPAPAPADGATLERLPGGAAGNAQQSGDNGADFQLVAPNPQNSGSALTPLPEQRLELAVNVPEAVPPGETFVLTVSLNNISELDLDTVQLALPRPVGFAAAALPAGAELVEGGMNGRPSISPPALRRNLPFLSRRRSLTHPNSYPGCARRRRICPSAFAPPVTIAVSGGAIPIGVARSLPPGQVVTIEGVATMYTGGFFAGSTGTKFYMEDETGGVQVYVPGGQGQVSVQIGDLVQVTGEIEYYRDSIEVIPLNIPGDVVVTGETEPPAPAQIAVIDNEEEDEVIGRLNQISGTATRIEEFSFAYEIDLTDNGGDTTLVYIEKDTGITVETLEVGNRYRITGVSEFYSARKQLKPRVQADIQEIFPPVLLLQMQAANNAQIGDMFAYQITVFNHLPTAVTNLVVTAPVADGLTVQEIGSGGAQSEGGIVWQVAELAGNGAAVLLDYTVSVSENAGAQIEAGRVTAVADQWPEPAALEPFSTFIGRGVPIWAIQGSGERSPYVGNEATTQGVVTAVFPELDGFWIQDLSPDADPATSDGLFILLDQSVRKPINVGELLEISGTVREVSGQTALFVADSEQLLLLESAVETLPAPIAYDPPADPAEALRYNEAREGMLVTVETPALVIAPTTRYGEYALVYEKWGVTQVRRAEPVGYTIFVDDGSDATFEFSDDQQYAVAAGDRVSAITGPLAFTFGNYKIEPLTPPRVERAEQTLPALSPLAENEFSVATFNVENLFDTQDPHPSSPPRPFPSEYERKLNKIAESILAMGAPTVIGLQEVENIGALEDLVAFPQLSPYDYQPVLVEGFDSRGIDVGYLVRGDQAEILRVEQFAVEDGDFSRPPLLIQVSVDLPGGPETFYVLNNHFLSLSAGEEATEPTRTAQAAWNVSVMELVRQEDPEARFIVLGDLNSFYQTLPLTTLEEAGLRHVYAFLPEAERPFTYIFEGRTQTLDHILVDPTLFDLITDVQAVHLNANFPLPDAEDDSPQRTSDHDPLVVRFAVD
jgi:uncharacterized repeat protein (TIGR01451 family)